MHVMNNYASEFPGINLYDVESIILLPCSCSIFVNETFC